MIQQKLQARYENLIKKGVEPSRAEYLSSTLYPRRVTVHEAVLMGWL